MNQNQVKEYFEEGRIKLTAWENVEHYFFLFPILVMPVMFLYSEISATGKLNRIPYFEIIMFLIGGYFIYHKYKSLEFKKFRLEHTVANFILAAKATALELDWEIEELTDNMLKAKKNDLLWQWDGLRITIIREGSKIYLNSIVNPSHRSNPFTIGWNKKNIQTFNNNLLYASNGEDVMERIKGKKKK